MRGGDAFKPVLLPLILIVVGVVLLLNNFLLLESFEVTALWPLLLVMLGAGVLLRGDFVPDDSTRSFGITRGSVESAVIEISAGEIDVRLQELNREGRLIAGQFAAQARPAMQSTETHAHLRLDRSATPWFNFANWELGLAQDLPWQLLVSSHLGHIDLDLSKLIIEGGIVASGIGDIRVVCPQETLSPLVLRSAFGSIQVIAPLGSKVRIHVEGARTFTVRTDERRYTLAEPKLYVTRDAAPDLPVVDLHIRGTFGDLYLA